MWDLDGAAYGKDALQMVVRGLGRVLTGQGKRASIQRGVIDDESQGSGIKRLAAPVVSECLTNGERRAGAIVRGAVDEEAVGGALVEIRLALVGEGVARGSRGIGRGRWCGGGVE